MGKSMPTPRLCLFLRGNSDWEELGVVPRVGIIRGFLRGFPERPTAGHEGGIALVLIPSGAVRERAFSFKRMSAWRYIPEFICLRRVYPHVCSLFFELPA
jgi:hypothetical protein